MIVSLSGNNWSCTIFLCTVQVSEVRCGLYCTLYILYIVFIEANIQEIIFYIVNLFYYQY